DQVRPPSGAGRPRTGPGGVSLCSSSRGEGHLWRDTSSGVGPCWSGRQSQATASYWGACEGSGGGRDGHLRGGRCGVERAVAEHREQHIAAASSEGDEGLVVLLLLGPLAVVVGAGVRVFQRCERGEEQGSFEDLVALPRGVIPTDRGDRTPGHGSEPSIGSKETRSLDGPAGHAGT